MLYSFFQKAFRCFYSRRTTNFHFSYYCRFQSLPRFSNYSSSFKKRHLHSTRIEQSWGDESRANCSFDGVFRHTAIRLWSVRLITSSVSISIVSRLQMILSSNIFSADSVGFSETTHVPPSLDNDWIVCCIPVIPFLLKKVRFQMGQGVIWAVAGQFRAAFATNFITMLLLSVLLWPQSFSRGEVSFISIDRP